MRSNFIGLSGWIKNSFIDFPGTVSTVLFFSGCNLRCPYCHNPSFILLKNDISDKSDEIRDFLQQRRKILDGVVITGGEPTLHPNIKELIKEIRSLGYKIKVDTNGLLPNKIEDFSPDYLAVDFKTTPKLYNKLLGVTFNDISERLKKSLSIVKNMGKNAEVRITVAPKIISKEIIQDMIPLIKGVSLVNLQPVNMNKEMLDPPFFTGTNAIQPEELQEYKEMISPHVGSCIIRNK